MENDILFLLSKEETELFTKDQLNFDTWWWLRSPFCSYSDSVWNVSSDGDLDSYDADDSGGVRPAFKSELIKRRNPADNITIGKFCGFKLRWTLSQDKSLYLLNNYIISSVFSFKNNNYKKSHIRSIVKAMEKNLVKELIARNGGII